MKKTRAVIGLGFGDEGKGITTEYLCSNSNNPLVIRFSGGQQAGHTVVKNGISHVFSNFGSGSLSNVPTYWSKFCTIDPIGIVNELNILKNKGVNPTLFINPMCPVTTPYDVQSNIELENRNNHGTCGLGVNATWRREEQLYSLRAIDILYPKIWREKLKNIGSFYDIKIDFRRFCECMDMLFYNGNVKIKTPDIHSYDTLIYEGSQGLLLDEEIGFYPNVTASKISQNNIEEIGLMGMFDVYFITRAYQTRHGNGFMTNEDIPHNISSNPNETNQENKYQGKFRRTLLDVDLLEYAIIKESIRCKTQGIKNLVITCLDHIKDELRLTYKGEIKCFTNEREFIRFISEKLRIDNVYVSHSEKSNNIQKINY